MSGLVRAAKRVRHTACAEGRCTRTMKPRQQPHKQQSSTAGLDVCREAKDSTCNAVMQLGHYVDF